MKLTACNCKSNIETITHEVTVSLWLKSSRTNMKWSVETFTLSSRNMQHMNISEPYKKAIFKKQLLNEPQEYEGLSMPPL